MTNSTDQLDERRLKVLSIIRDKMTSGIKELRQHFLDAVENNNSPWPWSIATIMTSSLEFGYLTLESDRCLKLQDSGWLLDTSDFLGASFADAKECILSMQDLSEWKVSTVPIEDIIADRIAAMLTALIPVVGVGRHNAGLHTRIGAGFRDELVKLIQQIDGEGWGIYLTQIE